MIRLRMVCLAAMVSGLSITQSLAPAQGKKPDSVKLPDSVELVRDVEYGKGGDRPLRLHILRPKEKTQDAMPVLVWIHGGGWQAGNKDSGISKLAPFAERG